MTSKSKSKPKSDPKPKKKKSESKKKPPVTAAAAGHNSGAVNVPLKKLFTEWEQLEQNKKEIGIAQKAIKARAKEEHGIPKMLFGHEIRMRKLDPDVRIHFEQGHQDLKVALGYQFALDLQKGPGSKTEKREPSKKAKPEELPGEASAEGEEESRTEKVGGAGLPFLNRTQDAANELEEEGAQVH